MQKLAYQVWLLRVNTASGILSGIQLRRCSSCGKSQAAEALLEYVAPRQEMIRYEQCDQKDETWVAARWNRCAA